MGRFAVIDTETNWSNQVMSIGCCVADTEDFNAVEMKYYVFPGECGLGGMYADVLFLDTPVPPIRCARAQAMRELKAWLRGHGVQAIFAYNAMFDRNHLPELGDFAWYDIMRIAAYRQHNPSIPADAPCCASGRLRRGYTVEAILRMLTGECTYCETHNAILDAVDELSIMRLLPCRFEDYIPL